MTKDNFIVLLSKKHKCMKKNIHVYQHYAGEESLINYWVDFDYSRIYSITAKELLKNYQDEILSSIYDMYDNDVIDKKEFFNICTNDWGMYYPDVEEYFEYVGGNL